MRSWKKGIWVMVLIFWSCTSKQELEIKALEYKASFFAKKCYINKELIWYNSNGQLNRNGAALISDIDKAHHFGLFTEVYHNYRKQLSYSKVNCSIQDKDVILTEVACLFFSHLKYGTLDELYHLSELQLSTDDLKTLKLLQKEGYQKVFGIFNDHNSIYSGLVSAQKTPFFQFKKFQDYKIDLSYGEYKNNKDSIYEYLADRMSRDDYNGHHDFKVFIAEFQKYHNLSVDSLLGKNSLPWLSSSNLDHFIAYVFTLNELRKEDFNPEMQLLVNIPAFKAQMWKGGKIDKEHKVIVGTEDHPTPELNAKVAYVETIPFWNVPFSISSKELLHHIQKDKDYIVRNNFEVFDHQSNKVHHDSVDWASLTPNSLPYVLRQKGGNDNALGYVKIIFPNEHAVYLHDTPSRHLFAKDVRTFSHGCMRLHQPIEFAEYLLSQRNENAPDLDSLIYLKQNLIVPLSKKIDIAVRYYLVGVNQLGHIEWYQDCYNKKKQDLAAIKSLYQEIMSHEVESKTSVQSSLLSYN